MLVGALWAAVAGVLKVRRGVSEVISTIMLNFVATGIIAYLLAPGRLAVTTQGSNNLGTKPIPPSGQVPGIALIPGTSVQVYGLIVLAVLVGVAFWFVVNRTRFGFDLRATGMSEDAAVASGVNVRRMVLGEHGHLGCRRRPGRHAAAARASYTYSLDFPSGLGFTGIAIALLGRNNPIGIAIGALLWAFLDQSAQILDLQDIPVEIVQITGGIIVLSVVVAYELVRRYRVVAEQRDVARASRPPRRPVRRSPGRRGHEPHERSGGRFRDAGDTSRPRLRRIGGWRGIALLAGVFVVLLSVVRLITGAEARPPPGRSAPRSPRPCRSAWPVSAGCGRNAPASSTSGSRA